MTTKEKPDARIFEQLKKIGLELEAPQDEFSYQPDSGSTASGSIGVEEYGIDLDPEVGGVAEIEDPATPIPGESSWSQSHRLPDEEMTEAPLASSDRDIYELINDRLTNHPHLNQFDFKVWVERGIVTLRGIVLTESSKMVAREIVESLSGVTEVRNELSVCP